MSVYAASIDDNDPQILYSDGWVLVTTDGDWKGTMHSTSVIGSTARVRFTGSRVAVVCTIPTGDGPPSQASFALDNGAAVNMAHATTPPVQWQTVFWDSGPLAFGSHLVVITNTGNTAYFRLDHIDYDPTSPSSPSSSVGSGITTVRSTLTSTVVLGTRASSETTTSTSGSSLSSGSQYSRSVSSSIETTIKSSGTFVSPTTSSTTGFPVSGTNINDAAPSGVSASPSTKSSSPTAGVVAGILGGLLGLLLLVLLFLYLRRRQRARSKSVQLPTDGDGSRINLRGPGSTIPTPFGVDRGTSHEMSTANIRPSPYGTHGRLSSPNNSMSMYTSGSSSESSTLMAGHQYQHLGSGGGTWGNGIGITGVAPRSKLAEFMAEQQQVQLVDTSAVSPTSGYTDGQGLAAGVSGGSTTVGSFQDAPPAYPGKG